MELSVEQIIIRLLVAALMGSAIGLERERLNWVAGLRTHMLVAVGSCLAMIVSAYGFTEVLNHKDVVLDPSRVAAQVVSGIGFLGAGTIFFWRKEILRGLTTAAALWAVASIGLAIGGGMYVAGVATTILVLIILALMKRVEKIFFKNEENRTHNLTIKIASEKVSIQQMEETIVKAGVELVEMKVNKVQDENAKREYFFEIIVAGKGKELLALADKFKGQEGVHSLNYQ